jgi:hypothetical protein
VRRPLAPFGLLVTLGLTLLDAPVAADAPACAPDRYYLLLFGGQGNVLRPRTAHTWATYVRITPRPNGTIFLEQFTISWLPATLDIRPWAIRSEPGVNLDLYQTLEFMSGSWQRISLWGPFEVSEEHYRNAARHKEELEAGRFNYRVFDFCALNPHVSHCVHAVTRTDPAFYRASPPILWFGSIGTNPVATGLIRSGIVADPHTTHDWLLPALGLDANEFIRRTPGDWFPVIRR